MPKNIIIINGSINSGKSTIAEELARIIPDSRFTEGDELGTHDSNLEKWIPTVLQALIQQAKELGCSNMFIAFPLRHENWEYLQQHLRANVLCITLSPPLDIALSSRNSRQLEDWERNRIQEMYREGYHKRSFSHLIHDNGQETPLETAQHLAQFLAEHINGLGIDLKADASDMMTRKGLQP